MTVLLHEVHQGGKTCLGISLDANAYRSVPRDLPGIDVHLDDGVTLVDSPLCRRRVDEAGADREDDIRLWQELDAPEDVLCEWIPVRQRTLAVGRHHDWSLQ